MKLEDLLDDSYEVERAKEISERISGLVREGLDRYEKAFKSKFVEIVRARGDTSKMDLLPLNSRGYSLGKMCDGFLKKQLKDKKRVREEYYEKVPESRPSLPNADEDGTHMPPLGMVPALVYVSGLKNLFSGLNASEKREMSNMFGISSEDMVKIFDHFHKIRNSCSHDRSQYQHSEFSFCLENFSGPSEIRALYRGKTEILNLKNNLFGTMTLLGHMLSNLPHENMYLSVGEWKYNMTEQLNIMHQKVLIYMGFSEQWSSHRIWRKSQKKSLQKIGVMYGLDFQILDSLYNELDPDMRKHIDSRANYISSKQTEKGLDTGDDLMDNLEWTARACVMKSVLGFQDDGYGIPEKYFNLAKALSNGSESPNDLVNALNDFHVEKMYNDSFLMCIPKGASDKDILEKIERWMRFDKKRRDSDFHKSFLMQSKIIRNGGSIIRIKDIYPVSNAPFLMDMAEELFHKFDVQPDTFFKCMDAMLANHVDEVPEWFMMLASDEHQYRVLNVHRRALMNRIGEYGIKKVIYNGFYKNLSFWPQEMIVDLDQANPNFKAEIEDGYKLRDPKKVDCEPYEAIFHYPFMLEEDIEEKLRESSSEVDPISSVDNALRYSYSYYCRIVIRKLQDMIDPSSIREEISMQPTLKKASAVAKGKFRASIHVDIMMGENCIAEMESVIPIEVTEAGGNLRLNLKRMKLACSREADKLAKKMVRKIKPRRS